MYPPTGMVVTSTPAKMEDEGETEGSVVTPAMGPSVAADGAVARPDGPRPVGPLFPAEPLLSGAPPEFFAAFASAASCEKPDEAEWTPLFIVSRAA